MYCVQSWQSRSIPPRRHTLHRIAIPRRLAVALAAAALLLGVSSAAQAGIVITVNKTTQRLSVNVNGEPRYVWPTSTARYGYTTPNGVYRPERLERKWYSRKYHWSPMPYSIFFSGGYAIHGSYETSRLGRPASHGCIRLHPRNAAVLFRLVQAHRGSTRIVVTGYKPSRRNAAADTRGDYAEAQVVRPPRSVYERRARTRHYRRSFDEIFADRPYYADPGEYYYRRRIYR